MHQKRLAIVSTHPIQYYAPIFQLLAKKITIKVFYTWGESVLKDKYDPGFQKKINWDIPLLENYDYHFTKNTAHDPGSHHYNGIINPNIIEEIKAFKATEILIYGYNYHGHMQIIRYFSGKIPLYFRGDSTLLDDEFIVKRWAKKIYLTWVYRHFDKIFYVGKANKAYFKHFGVKDSKLAFAPHAVDNKRFFLETNRNELREKWGLVEEDILILFAGKLEYKKNPQLLLKAFDCIAHENLHLLFVGSGNIENTLKQQAQDTDKRNKIYFESFKNQSEMPSLYHACDIFCLPSKGPGETWGLAINEAMAAGKAIIASDKVGCVEDLVCHKENGYIFKSNDLDDLVNGINFIIQKNNWQTLGKLSKKIVNSYTLEIQAQLILENLS